MTNVVLGVSVNFKPIELKNLILSFREVNREDDLVLFIDDVNLSDAKKLYENYNVKFYAYHMHEIVTSPIHNTRHIRFLEFLLDNPQYEKVFMTDTKDVIFQHNPFESMPHDGVFVFQEDSNFRIVNDQNVNAWWIKRAYGEEVYNLMKSYNVICSGTILGSYQEIVIFLKAVKNEIKRIKNDDRDVFVGMILDQAIVNWMCRLHPVFSNDVFIKENGDIVATLGVTTSTTMNEIHQRDEVLIKEYSLMVNKRIPSVLHQYDRNDTLKKLFDAKYQL